VLVIPRITTAPALADWVEASLILNPAERITDTAILDALVEADLADAEDLLGATVRTIRTRSTVVAMGYPIRRNGLGFSSRGEWERFLPYCFMLLVSMNQIYAELRFRGGSANRPAELFEQVTAAALKRYLNGSVFRLGAPRRVPVPTAFPAALKFVTNQMNEAEGPQDLVEQDNGDDGADLVGWVTFGDARESQAILLAQCAIGTDWRDKRNEINLEVWRRHIDWHSTPMRGFAVPFHHDHGNPWRETASAGGVIFDRLRIARLVRPTAIENGLRDAMETWCQRRLQALAGLVPA
jgi:hypothetical protein